MTKVNLDSCTLHIPSLSTQEFTLPMSLDSLTHTVGLDDPARVILYARHYPNIPSNIRGVFRSALFDPNIPANIIGITKQHEGVMK